jgi:hypothetical protein
MNTTKTRNWTAPLLAALLSIPFAASAESVLHGRISYDAGGTLIKGVEENEWSSGSVNTLILPGDTVWVDNGGTAELEFSGGSFLRLADGSKAEVAGLAPNNSIRGWTGSFYVQRLRRSTGDFVFYTPAGVVEVKKDTAVRIDILDDGLTTVSTRWGRATVRTDAGGSVTAHSGKRVFVEAGLLPSQPAPFDRAAEDAFDRWNRERSEFLATGSTRTPSSVKISSNTLGVSDLDRYGEWVYVDNNPCWRPTAIVDYTPYHHGYWNNVHSVGNVWVGNYPFSYITSHHGYWDHHARHGWIWSYTPQWSPAWAATVRYGDYFVWAPVNRHFHPVYPHSTSYFGIGGISFGHYGTSYAHVDHLYHGPSYVNFAHHNTFRNYYGHGGVSINIWNINTNNRPHVRVPFNNSVTTVRNYSPRRSIRGASTFQVAGRSATERVQRLESASGRSTFSRASRTGGQFVRTNAGRANDTSRLRTARISQSTPDFARATRGNPVRATNNRSRSGNTATLANTRSDRSTTTTRPTRQAISMRTSSDRSTSARTSNSRGSSRGNTTTKPQRTDIDPRSGSSFNERTPITTYRRTPTRSSNSDRTTTATRTPQRDTRPTTTSRTPTRSTSERSGSTASSTRNRVTPSTTSRGNQTPRVTQPTRTTLRTSTPSRSVAPRQSAPTRTAAPRQSAPTRTSTSRQSTSRQSAPTRSVAPRQSAPTRSVAPRRSAPTRSVAPRQSAPTRSMSTPPSRQTSVRSPAPSRSSSRSSASAPTSSRSRATAPTRSTSRGGR